MIRLLTLALMLFISSTTIVDFTPESELSQWRVVDDGVMGGRSAGDLYLDDEGHAVFTGKVSLENNGGFSSIRHRFRTKDVEAYDAIVLYIKGDGKRYQFRVKESARDYHSYGTYFSTTGVWQVIEIPFSTLSPQFRGRKLPMPNFAGQDMQELAFLIGNKTAESFRLEIDKIELR